MFQSYSSTDFGPDTELTIKPRIDKLKAEGRSGEDIVLILLAEGHEVDCDGSGYVHVAKGREKCDYPLAVRTLPSRRLRPQESYEAVP